METPRILLIDDDSDMEYAVKQALNPLVMLDYTNSFEEAKKYFRVHDYSLILLDLYLAEDNGLDLIEFQKSSKYFELEKTIIISGEKNIENMIRGHNLGVRDFLLKPFNIKLLRSILDKHLFKILKSPKKSIQQGPILLDLIMHKAFILDEDGKKLLNLTQKEFSILQFLMENSGQIFSRDTLFERIWNEESESLSRTIDMHISSLRKKLTPHSGWIKNKRSIGYYFDQEKG